MKKILLIICSFCFTGLASAQDVPRLSFAVTADRAFVAALDHAFHVRYGCMYPLTFQMDIPHGLGQLQAKRKYASDGVWGILQEETSNDVFNAIEAVRFDYSNDRAYVSAAFSAGSDSLFLQISDSLSNPIALHFDGISRYYDNRNAVVTVTADDWSDWVVLDGRFPALINIFRSYNLYVTVGIITLANYSSRATWSLLQQELDSGFVEVASHSRTHPATPYADPVGEVIGSSQDVKNGLALPPLFTMNGTDYVYTWIAPYGDYDSTVDSLAGIAGYLAARRYTNQDTAGPRTYVYGDSTLSAWDSLRNHFLPFWPTVELGAPVWGGGDTSLVSLNGLFDTIVAKGDIYHCMWHPQVLYGDRDSSYLRGHLSHISNRSNIWYVNLGHLYLYHLIQESTSPVITDLAEAGNVPQGVRLFQNYPNPFNPATMIRYYLPASSRIRLTVQNLLGQVVGVLRAGVEDGGYKQVEWNAGEFTSGVYFYRLEATNPADPNKTFVQSRKMILLH